MRLITLAVVVALAGCASNASIDAATQSEASPEAVRSDYVVRRVPPDGSSDYRGERQLTIDDKPHACRQLVRHLSKPRRSERFEICQPLAEPTEQKKKRKWPPPQGGVCMDANGMGPAYCPIL